MPLEAMRSQERFRRILQTSWAGVLSKLVSVGASLLSVPMAMNYMGVEGYGLWMAVSSVVMFLGVADGGIANGVINVIARLSASSAYIEMRGVVSSAFFLLLLISVVCFLLFYAVALFIPWSDLLGVSGSTPQSDVLAMVLIVAGVFFANFTLGLVGKIQRALQEGYLEHLWAGIGSMLSLFFMFVAIQVNAGFLWVVGSFLCGTSVAFIFSNIVYFFYMKKKIRPTPALLKLKYIKEVAGVGFLFFILQLSSAVGFESDNILIANILGASAVAEYAITMKLFLFLPLVASFALMPLWGAYSEAFASGDTVWIKSTFLKSVKLSCLVSVPLALLMAFMGEAIINYWVGNAIHPSMGLIIGAALWAVLMTLGNALAMFLNAMNIIRVQVIVSISMAILNVFLSIFLIHRVGVEGAVYGSIIATLICNLIPYGFILPYFYRRLSIDATHEGERNVVTN